MRLLVSLFLMEVLVGIVEDSEAVRSTTLEISLFIVSYAENLFRSPHRFNNVQVLPIEEVDIPMAKCATNIFFIAECIVNFVLALHLFL